MAIQILPQYSGGGELGAALGGGLSSGIQNIAQQKLNEYALQKQFEIQAGAQQKQIQEQRAFEQALRQQDMQRSAGSYQQLFNLSPEESLALASNPNANQIVKELVIRGGFAPALAPTAEAAPTAQQPQSSFMDVFTKPAGLANLPQVPGLPRPAETAQAPSKPTVGGILSQPRPETPQMKLQRELAQTSEKGREERFEKELGYKVDKDTRKEYSGLSNQLKSIDDSLLNNDIILTALDKGDVQSPTFLKALGYVGLDAAFKNPTTATLQKAAADQWVRATDSWKGKGSLSDREGQALRATVSDYMSQGPAGAAQVAKMSKLMDMAKRSYLKEEQNIIREKGKIPFDLEEEALKRSFDEREQYKKQLLDIVEGSGSKKTVLTKGSIIQDLPDPKTLTPAQQAKVSIRDTETNKEWKIVNGKWKEA